LISQPEKTKGPQKKKERIDKLLLDRGLALTRQKAQALVMAGLVFSGNRRIEKPGEMIGRDQQISLKNKIPFVSRGGLKLEEALERWHVSVKDRVAADLGASTGGFTDCLLQRGARKVFAVDVDIRQLDCHLRENVLVRPIEMNARFLKKGAFDEPPDIVTTDLSFISVLKIMPAVREWLGEGILLTLIKPQFEVGKGKVGKKGIIRDPAVHEETLRGVIRSASEMGFNLKGLMKCSTPGQKGNREFFAFWRLRDEILSPEKTQGMIKEAVWDEHD
jgi:23S rRNA (cytidine1920-2'-O)/16S rRNA (cytidine1409-2'-O)-methyltransferase